MTQRIAPNNQLPATHFIEVWRGLFRKTHNGDIGEIEVIDNYLESTQSLGYRTIAVFKIRCNIVPTKHNFNK